MLIVADTTSKWRRTAMNDSGAIEERLARLERGVKRGKCAARATMVLLVLLIGWSAAARSGKARAGSGAGDLVGRSLTIVDEKGTTRVFVTVVKDSPAEVFYDEKGNRRIGLKVIKDSPAVVLYGEKKNERIGLTVTKDGSPTVFLNDEKGHPRAVLGSMELERARTGDRENTAPSSLVLFDNKGNVIWRAP
jgi:hypothetical protein